MNNVEINKFEHTIGDATSTADDDAHRAVVQEKINN